MHKVSKGNNKQPTSFFPRKNFPKWVFLWRNLKKEWIIIIELKFNSCLTVLLSLILIHFSFVPIAAGEKEGFFSSVFIACSAWKFNFLVKIHKKNLQFWKLTTFGRFFNVNNFSFTLNELKYNSWNEMKKKVDVPFFPFRNGTQIEMFSNRLLNSFLFQEKWQSQMLIKIIKSLFSTMSAILPANKMHTFFENTYN